MEWYIINFEWDVKKIIFGVNDTLDEVEVWLEDLVPNNGTIVWAPFWVVSIAVHGGHHIPVLLYVGSTFR